MHLVRCEKGHFYDQDKNGDRCPYCAQMASAAAAPVQQSAPRQPETAPGAQIPPQPVRQEAPAPHGFAQTGGIQSGTAQSIPGSMPGSSAQSVSGSMPAGPAQPSSSPQAGGSILSDTTDALQRSVSDIMAETEDNCTVGYYSRVIGVEPVVGWLVCTEGEYKGESFKLKSGRNFIGRAANMDVVLSADHSISRFKHAAVIYEPRSRQFIVTAGESRELCYLNGQVVLSNIKMEAYDILNLGNTSLMLVPCCGKRFSWEEGLTKEPEQENRSEL